METYSELWKLETTSDNKKCDPLSNEADIVTDNSDSESLKAKSDIYTQQRDMCLISYKNAANDKRKDDPVSNEDVTDNSKSL